MTDSAKNDWIYKVDVLFADVLHKKEKIMEFFFSILSYKKNSCEVFKNECAFSDVCKKKERNKAAKYRQ